MKAPRPVIAVVLLSIAALCTVAVASRSSAALSSSLPQVVLTELVIEPSAEHESAYECSATIVDARTGETVASPRVLFPSGEDATIRSGVALDGESARVDVIVSANANDRTAQVRVELARGSETTTVQQLRVRL